MFKTDLKLETLREIVEIPSSIVKDIQLTVAPTGIEMRAADGGRIAMIEIAYTDKVFSNFQGSESILLFELKKLGDTLKLGKPGQTVNLSYDDKDRRLTIKIGASVRNMTLLDATANPPPPRMPKLNFDAYAVLQIDWIKQALLGGEIVDSDEIDIDFSEERGLILSAEDKADNFKISIPKEELKKYEFKPGDDGKKLSSHSIYPRKQIAEMIDSLKGVEQIVIHTKTKYPLKIDFDLTGGLGRGKFLLAPRTSDVNTQQ